MLIFVWSLLVIVHPLTHPINLFFQPTETPWLGVDGDGGEGGCIIHKTIPTLSGIEGKIKAD